MVEFSMIQRKVNGNWFGEPVTDENQISGGDALRGHTRSHPEHDG